MDDHELLREFATNHSDSAFAELVARHVNHVYTTAVRLVGDHAQAQDVVQAVFISLARQAGALQHSRALGGWLYRVTCNCAKDAWRAEQRRRRREAEAVRIAELQEPAPSWEAVAPLLDEALGKLKSGEQNAVVLRFFEGKSLRETGAELGLSEDAAQKRIARALEKMLAHFARGGITVAVGALSAGMATNTCKAAPVGLASRVTGTALAETSGVGVGSIFGRILFMSTKTKFFATVVAMALIITFLEVKSTRPQAAAVLPMSSNNGVVTKAVAMTSLNKTPVVALPVVAAAPAKAENDPQADLKTAIPELVRQLRTGMGFSNFTPPNDLAEMGMDPEEIQKGQESVMRSLRDKDPANDNLRKMVEENASAYEALESQVPTFNAAGDVAKYMDVTGNFTAGPLTFIKISGKWYLTDDPDVEGTPVTPDSRSESDPPTIIPLAPSPPKPDFLKN